MRGQAVGVGGVSTPTPITIILPGPIGPVAVDLTVNWYRVTGDLDLSGALAYILAKTAPATTAPSWDIMRSVDSGSSFSTILPSGASNKLQLPVGQRTASLTPAWTVTSLLDGDLIRVDLVQTDDGTGSDIEITLVPQ